MPQTDPEMKSYSFEVPAETWNDWKRGVPRDKSLDDRIIELLEEDTDD